MLISVLKMNSKPDSNANLTNDLKLDIIGQEVETDGFIDNFKVLVSYADSDGDGIADDPDVFKEIVAPTVNVSSKVVFLEKTTDFDNLERYLPVASGHINTLYADLDAMELAKTEYLNGQVFYGTTDKKFYKLTVVGTTYTLAVTTDYIYRTGRADIYFQYRHNSSNNKRVDPGITNIIDMFLVTNPYYTSYQNWITDGTGTVTEPDVPTIDELAVAYGRPPGVATADQRGGHP